MDESIGKRFWSKVRIGLPDDCWEWQANLGRGYGMFWFGKHSIVAHRVSWIMLRGEIPGGLNVLHRCDNKKCVNPNHLFLGTHSHNSLDMLRKDKGGDYRNSKTKTFTKDEILDILLSHSNGDSLRNIAIKYNTTHQTIKRAMDDGRIGILSLQR